MHVRELSASSKCDVEAPVCSPECAGIYLYIIAREIEHKTVRWYSAERLTNIFLTPRPPLATRVVLASREQYIIDRAFAQQLLEDVKGERASAAAAPLSYLVCDQPLRSLVAALSVAVASASAVLHPLAVGYLAGTLCTHRGALSLLSLLIACAPFGFVHAGTALLTAAANAGIAALLLHLPRTSDHHDLRSPDPAVLRFLVADLLPWGLLQPAVQVIASVALLLAVSWELAVTCLVGAALTYSVHRCHRSAPNVLQRAAARQFRHATPDAFRPVLAEPARKAAATCFQLPVFLFSLASIWLEGQAAGGWEHQQGALVVKAVTLCLLLKTPFAAAETLALALQRARRVKGHL